jgi:uncharacterized protein (TIGR00251 family)
MIISIHVKPNSKTDQIAYDDSGELKVKIRAQPVDGKANQYLIEYLAGIFQVPKSRIEILKGSNNQHKKVEILDNDIKVTSFLHGLKNAK